MGSGGRLLLKVELLSALFPEASKGEDTILVVSIGGGEVAGGVDGVNGPLVNVLFQESDLLALLCN
jgi:hypothetical protein